MSRETKETGIVGNNGDYSAAEPITQKATATITFDDGLPDRDKETPEAAESPIDARLKNCRRRTRATSHNWDPLKRD